MNRLCRFTVLALVLSYLILTVYGQDAAPGPIPPGVLSKRQPDGVWRFGRSVGQQPNYWQLLLSLFGWKPLGTLPFRRSVAFLAGVGSYDAIRPQLPYVDSDLTELRNFLLTQGGFDTVFEVRNEKVNRTLIEEYMVNKFASESDDLSRQDRLLFYYSGHGADQNGSLGYLQFSKATSSNFAGNNVLPLHSFQDWAKINIAKHLVIILDSCASGLAIRPQGAISTSDSVLKTISGEGSGFLLTAGTGDQETWEVELNNHKGYSIFTHALLEAWSGGVADAGNTGFFTINELFGQIEKNVAQFSAEQGKKVTPQLWHLSREEGIAKGTFVFLNTRAQNPKIPSRYAGFFAVAKRDTGDPTIRSWTDSVSIDWVLLPEERVRKVFGDDIANDYSAIQLTVFNLTLTSFDPNRFGPDSWAIWINSISAFAENNRALPIVIISHSKDENKFGDIPLWKVGQTIERYSSHSGIVLVPNKKWSAVPNQVSSIEVHYHFLSHDGASFTGEEAGHVLTPPGEQVVRSDHKKEIGD